MNSQRSGNGHFLISQLAPYSLTVRAMPLLNNVTTQTVCLLDAVATATNMRERRAALDLAVLALDHDNTSYHDATYSGIALLTRCLQRDLQNEDKELNMLYFRVIRLLLRCSDENAIAAIHQIGADLVSLVLTVVDNTGSEMDSASGSAVRSLIDRLADLDVSWPDVKKKEHLIRFVQRLCRRCDCCFLASVTVQLLGGWSQHPNSKRYVLNQPGLVDDVMAITLDRLSDTYSSIEGDHLMFHIASLLRNLAWNAYSKSELVSKTGFLVTLCHMISRNRTNMERGTAVRSVAFDVLRQLCTEAVCRRAVCKHDKGSIVRSIVASNDPLLNQTANHIILRLIGHDTASILFRNESCIIERLENAAKTDMDNPSIASDASSILAAHALKRAATYVSVNNKCHPHLLDALLVLASAKNNRIRSWAVRGLQEQSKNSSGRFYMTRTSIALTTLIQIAKVDPCRSVKAAAVETLLAIALDTANAKRLANNSELLETFAEAATQKVKKAKEFQPSARCAIQAILSLACHKTTNKHRVAKTLGLVESLSLFGISQDMDVALKHAALHCVIVLAPLM